MRKALVVGIDYYEKINPLFGCVNDAHAMKAVLERDSDGTVNFGVKLLTGTGPTEALTRSELKDAVKELFADQSDIAFFYFAGHGHIEATGGYLCTSESGGDDGFPLNDLLLFANKSPARNKIIVLDSCHSGRAGAPPATPAVSELSEGLTILTASTAEQYASEENGSGVFTSLFVDAMHGGAAANLVGDITPGGIYAHIDQSLGPWEQRPVFKTNVKSFVSLRKVQPNIGLPELRKIAEFFPVAGYEYQLDPSYEPEGPCPDEVNTAKFAILQKYNRVDLVVPVGAPHMYHAAMESKTCKLTVLGEHYRKLVKRGRI